MKTGSISIAVGEIIWRIVAKCIAKEAAIEAAELYGAKELGFAVRGGTESIVLATKKPSKKCWEQKVGAYSKLISETHLIRYSAVISSAQAKF